MLRKMIYYMGACGLLLILSGCWDRVEIDQRGFVVGVAVDMPSDDQNKKNKTPTKYLGTYQIIVPINLKQSSGGGGSSGSESSSGSSPFFNTQTTDQSMPALSARLASINSRTPYFEHLKMIIIAGDTAKTDSSFPDVLDYFLRDNEMRRAVRVLITDGKASEILNVKALNEKYPVAFIESIVQNDKKTNFMLPETRIGDIHEHLLKKESFLVQKISTNEEGVSLDGAALLDGKKNYLVGFLSGRETQGVNFITNQARGGIIESQYEDQMISYEVERAERTIQAEIRDQRPAKFIIKIETEGSLGKSTQSLNLYDPQVLESIEESFEDEIKRSSLKAINTLQNKYKKDPLGLGAHLYKRHYQVWKQVEDNWEQGEQLFSITPVEVQVKVHIRRTGNIYKNESG
jgi:spore germination protein